MLRKFSFERTISVGNPRSTRFQRVLGFIANFLAHLLRDIVWPSKVRLIFVLRLFCCSSRVAQRQFSGEYPFVPSMRSSERSFGGSPISATKVSKFNQRSQTVM